VQVYHEMVFKEHSLTSFG